MEDKRKQMRTKLRIQSIILSGDMKEKVKCSKSNSESRKPELKESDRLCRIIHKCVQSTYPKAQCQQ